VLLKRFRGERRVQLAFLGVWSEHNRDLRQGRRRERLLDALDDT
jgi:hypothetical protein